MNDDKVVHAFQSLPENPLQIAKKPSGLPIYCRHDSIRIDKHDRVVNCAGCGATLDPFDFLLTSAAVIQQAWQRHKEVMHTVGELVERVDFLKKEEKRMRALVKRLEEKAPKTISMRTL